ncbi:MAG: CBS domain-containing protein, partial [Deltaproteobacteria bacterium]|nr:CBS domain-containing protein [Deltaproteobacteria bacterium]
DGDLRRALERGNDLLSKKAGDIMTSNPKSIEKDALAESALKLMEDHSITSLFVLAKPKGSIIGVVHLHDLIKAGVL